MRSVILLIIIVPLFLSASNQYDFYFETYAFRFEFMLGGNANEVKVYPQQMKQEPFWAGPKANLIDTFNYGSYRFIITDYASGKLIFTRGFNTLFQEWQTTTEAKNIDRMFYQCLLFPFPRHRFTLSIEARQWDGHFVEIYSKDIDPADYFIIKEPVKQFESFDLISNGDPNTKVDLLILAEGYKEEERTKFLEDAQRVTGYLFDEEPFASSKQSFNVKAVFTPSEESGTDIPGEGIYKNTIFSSSFYTFDIDRYLTTGDMQAIYDAAASVPYDHIYILVNSDRYGGGGIYNFLNVCTSDHPQTREVFIHEFGHGFAGLGDEYYSSSVSYENFYNLKTEPWEPNITTLVNFELKWADMVHDSVPVPTPRDVKYQTTTGVYEGGGYQKKGIFSPYMNCRMKSNDAKGFCPVCIRAIQRVIDFYSH